jgi:hypothetical protein
MAWVDFKFTPEDGLENTTTFPSKPGSGAAARAQPMTLFNQIKAFLNGGVKDYVDEHKADIMTEEGRHGLRYWNDKLEFFDGSDWIEIETGGGGLTFGVSIDLTNTNPETAVTYTDDAVGMTPGSAWNSMPIFKDIKPCVLKNGVVQYYLNPNDLTKKADGTSADITSGNDGDVMIEIPKTGYSISTAGNTLTVKVTDDPNNPNFKYYAHSRAAEGDRSKLYIGAYLGWNDGGKLRSLSGKTPTADQTIGTFRTQAQANGAGYDIVSFYPLTLLQCLFLIKYKNRDSQTALGKGYVGGSAAQVTGATNSNGMDYGTTSDTSRVKFLGIEDMWGNLRWFIDGFFSDASRNMLTAFTDFNDTGSGYTDRGQGATSDIGNYMSKPQGTSQTGFIAKEVSGSASTYFCDYAALYASRLPNFGGSWTDASNAGAFYLLVNDSASYSSSNRGGRLMYL